MHNINEMFEKYLPDWSNKYHKPIPTKNHPEKWNEAWLDFIEDILIPQYDDLKQDYLDLSLKIDTYNLDNDKSLEISKKINTENNLDTSQPSNTSKKSNWELVQEKRKKKF